MGRLRLFPGNLPARQFETTIQVSSITTHLYKSITTTTTTPPIMSLLRPSSRIIRSTALQATRSYAAAATTQTSSSSSSPAIKVTHSTSNSSSPLLSNIEANWIGLPQEEQYEVYRKLEEIQKRDWKELTVDEKKAGEWGIAKMTSNGSRGVER